MIVFQSQFDEVERATPRARMGKGKISPMRTQAPGPQVEAKNEMKMAINLPRTRVRTSAAGGANCWRTRPGRSRRSC